VNCFVCQTLNHRCGTCQCAGSGFEGRKSDGAIKETLTKRRGEMGVGKKIDN
jgi:hypothetical protein